MIYIYIYIIEIRGERETRRQHRYEHLESVGFRRGRRQQRRDRLFADRPVSGRRSGILRDPTGIRVDRPKETTRRKCFRQAVR